jgi:hypothetical protein
MTRKSSATALNNLCDRLNSGLLDNKIAIPVTFVAGTTGSVASHPLLTVTGTVALSVFGVVNTDVTGSGTIEVGTAAATGGLIPTTTGTTLDTPFIWFDATPSSSIELTSVITQNIVTSDVVYKIASNTLTGGKVTFYVLWAPISDDGNVVAA